jgi:hypothetical protein
LQKAESLPQVSAAQAIAVNGTIVVQAAVARLHSRRPVVRTA